MDIWMKRVWQIFMDQIPSFFVRNKPVPYGRIESVHRT